MVSVLTILCFVVRSFHSRRQTTRDAWPCQRRPGVTSRPSVGSSSRPSGGSGPGGDAGGRLGVHCHACAAGPGARSSAYTGGNVCACGCGSVRARRAHPTCAHAHALAAGAHADGPAGWRPAAAGISFYFGVPPQSAAPAEAGCAR